MRILMVHNSYQQPGGEDRSFATDRDVLRDAGHEVVTFTRHNDAIDGMGRLDVALKTIWNRDALSELSDQVAESAPDIVHFQNTFPLVSPAAYRAATRHGVPVVQSLRNFRLTCVNGLLFRDGQVCTRCVGRRMPWDGIRFACYRDDRAASAVAAAMVGVHRSMGSWTEHVDRFIAVSGFMRELLADVVPPARVVVEPNCVHPDPGSSDGAGGYALFLGRLSAEKGVGTLLDAWEHHGVDLPLVVAGGGPLESDVRARVERLGNVQVTGQVTPERANELLADARMLVFPSEWLEPFGRTVIEAMAHGTPVVAADIGGPAELVDDGVTGRLFLSGDARALADAVHELGSEGSGRYRRAARAAFEQRWTGPGHAANLVRIYEHARA